MGHAPHFPGAPSGGGPSVERMRTGSPPESARTGSEPAPIGIADLGKTAAGPIPSQFNTTTFRGQAAIGAMTADNASIPGTATSVSLQLNAFYLFSYAGTTYAYWVQDVLLFDTATRGVEFEDNIWNVTSVDLAGSAVRGNGTVTGTGSNSYYGDTAPCTLPEACGVLADPENVTLELRAALAAGGVPTVRVGYAVGGSLVTYDVVQFRFARSLSDLTGFEVDAGLGLPSSCPRCYGDVEFVVGGPGYGYQTALVGFTRVDLTLRWWNGYDFVPVPNAVNYGEATEEGLGTATVSENTTVGTSPGVTITYGAPTPLGVVWSDADLAVVQVSSVGAATGSVTVGAQTVPLVRGYAELAVLPGVYAISVVAGTSYSLGAPTLVAGESLTLEVGGYAVVFAPSGLPSGALWSVVLGARVLNGTGNITFGVPAGTYPFSVDGQTGYSVSPTSGTVSVPGTGDVVPVTWTHARPSLLTQLFGAFGPWTPLLIFLAVVIAVAAVVSAVQGRRRPGAPPPDQEF